VSIKRTYLTPDRVLAYTYSTAVDSRSCKPTLSLVESLLSAPVIPLQT